MGYDMGPLTALGNALDEQARKIAARAAGIAEETGSKVDSITFDQDTSSYVLVTSRDSSNEGYLGNEINYNIYYLQFKNGNVIRNDSVHVKTFSKLYFSLFNGIISRQMGTDVEITQLGCFGTIEFVAEKLGPISSGNDIRDISSYSAWIFSNKRGSFVIRMGLRQEHDRFTMPKSVEIVNSATNDFRTNFTDLIASLRPHISEQNWSMLMNNAGTVVNNFRSFTSSAENIDGNRGMAIKSNGSRDVKIITGMDMEAVKSTMLHELLHLVSFENSAPPPQEGSQSAQSTSIPLIEGINEFLTRWIIAHHLPAPDFEACPCHYYSADLIYIFMRLGIITLDDIVSAHSFNASTGFKEKINLRLGKGPGDDVFGDIFYTKIDDIEEWFSNAISILERHGVDRDTIRNILEEAGKEQMATPDSIDVVDGKRIYKCPIEEMF